MSIFSLCKLRAIGCAALWSVLALAGTLPANAVELVGKPVSISGQQSSAGASSNTVESNVTENSSVAIAASSLAAVPTPPEAPDAPETDDADWNKHWDQFGHNNGHFFEGARVGDVLIPLVAIAFIFGGPIVLILFLGRMHYRDRARRTENINNNIDKLLANGRDIPIELLRGDDPKDYSSMDYLRRALRNLGLGIGLLLFLGLLCGFDIGAVGFLLIAYGCSQLVVWYLARRDQGVGNGL